MTTGRKVLVTVDSAARTMSVRAKFSLGLPENKRLERGNYAFHPLRDSYNDNGKALAEGLMSNDSPDGWLVLTCHNAYAFTVSWFELFEETDMVELLKATLYRIYGADLEFEVSQAQQADVASAS